jgi:cyanate lyase
MRAAQFIYSHDTTAASPRATELYQTRLAALDEIAQASRQASYIAPADPFVYRYYQAANAAREATIRQLGTLLPAGTRISRF